jgi:hypothetical protein
MRRAGYLLAVVVAAMSFALAACSDDGGDTGTDYPDAGEDNFERTTATVQIEVSPEGVAAPGAVRLQELETVDLEGPALVTRSDPELVGDVYVVTTEIVEMELAGTASFGDVVVRQSAENKSMGEVRQKEPGQDFPADSYFDVFVEVEIPGLNLMLHNEEPMHMEAQLSSLPPGEGDGYRGEDDRPLYTPAGLQVGRIVDALHIPNPPSATEEPDATDEPTEEPTEEGATATEPSGGDQVEATQTMGCEHTQPGVQSDLLDLILLIFAGAEPVEGATVRATAFGSGVLETSAEGVTNAEGEAQLRWPINRFGAYTARIDEVIGPDGTPLELSPSSQTEATFTVGQTCTKPPGF